MGNTSTKESRGASPPPLHHHRNSRSFSGPSSSTYAPETERAGSSSLRLGRRQRGENFEAALLGLSISHAHRDREREREREEGPYKTREERRAEKEAERKKEREKERERSMAEESVDGGYLVTVGVYTGPEDYNSKVVRQLQIERRLAPFWKGIPDHESDWTDAQLVAAVHGKDIPDASAVVPPSPTKAPAEDLNRLTVPMASRSRSQSYGSDASPSSSTGRLSSFSLSSSPLAGFSRPRSKTLGFSRSSSSNSTPVETNIPSKTVNNRPIEAVLYENASECPICFLYYPPHLNRTRCCDQPICSECFVQIKRADPHIPEHSPPGSPAPQPVDQDRRAHAGDQLISEPASCPFCKQPEFGVVFTPLPWRRGLVYANQTHPYGIQQQSHLSHSSNTSSTSSLPVPGTPNSPRKKTSYAVNAPEVITTDRIRPDWATKLAHAKNQAARRAAAATALHTAAYLMHNMSNQSTSTSSNPFSSRRILRRMNNSSGSMTPNGGSGSVTPAAAASTTNVTVPEAQEPLTASAIPAAQNAALQNVLRRARMVDLEEMMLMEAIRLSLAEEEERKRKEEKERKAKEEADAEAERAAARLATSAPEPSRSMDLGKGKGLAPRVDTVSIGRRSEDMQSSPTIGFGGSSQHLKMHRATSDVSSSASSMKEPEAGSSDDEDGTEPMFNFQSLAQTLMEAEDGETNGNNMSGKGKQAEHAENVVFVKKEVDATATMAPAAAGEEPDTADSKTTVRQESVRILGQETA